MTLIVETGSGVAGADSYLSVADFRAYIAAYGLTIPTSTDAECEVSLRLATRWIDTWRRYKGVRLATLEFPRDGLADWSGTLTGVPKRVTDACAELAARHRNGTSLAADTDKSAYVRSRAVGPISTTYRDDAPTVTVFTVVERLLEPLVRDIATPQMEPYYGGSSEALFDRGMMAAPGPASVLVSEE